MPGIILGKKRTLKKTTSKKAASIIALHGGVCAYLHCSVTITSAKNV